MQACALATIDCLLGQPEVAARPPAHLDDHEPRWRPRVDREDVDLRPSHPKLPRENAPALRFQALGDPGFRLVAAALRRSSHRGRVAIATYAAITSSGPTRTEALMAAAASSPRRLLRDRPGARPPRAGSPGPRRSRPPQVRRPPPVRSAALRPSRRAART